ncbi:MAG TPA: CehA/McbA family metallohydrolase [Chloroflexota bacterium]|nr:CehA/McbA family metallohydrolase [Chloroflexota bacterium]
MSVQNAVPGRLALHPDTGTIGEWGTWTARYTAGPGGLPTGGAIQVELPITWHQWLRNSSRAVQATQPSEPFYVSARASREGARVRCEVQEEQGPDAGDPQLVKRPRKSLEGKNRRYAWVVRVTVDAGALQAGDTIDVLYGDRTGGGRGFTPPLWAASPEPVRAAVDPTGGGAFTPLPADGLPLLHVRPAPPAEVVVYLPSISVVGQPHEVVIAALDPNLNPSWPDGMRVSLRVVEGDAQLSAAEVTCPAGDWSARATITPRAAGLIRVRAQSDDGALYSISNPSRAIAERPTERLWWGELHGHSELSWDATGPTTDAFRYARDVSALQFYGNADHGESFSAEDWERLTRLNAEHLDEGKFVTLVGYENSQKFPFGHHNVFYRGASGALRHANDLLLDAFLKEAVEGDAIAIPHHMIALGNPSRPNTNWELHDPRFHRVAEIYSGHGQSELSIDDSPLASDVVDFTLTGPAAAPSSLREGWLRGHKFGVIASSDNHIARPGRDGFGVAAVWATELTRAAIFDALHRRRTFGSTGCRVILDFTLNGVPMGGEARLREGEPARITGEIVASNPLRFVEILRADLEAHEWTVAKRHWWAGGAPTVFQLDWTDDAPPRRGLYYIRLRQRDVVHGRVAMAWSSPVWVER